jgi:amino acid adenylation domain-containing protein/thioester reductase-like protein
MSKRLTNLSAEEKRELLIKALKKKAEEAARAPLSLQQEGLWFLDQLAPGNPLYHISQAIRIRGAINLDASRRALNELVKRHESLRTTLHAEQGAPFQVVSPPRPLPMKLIDLTELAGDEQEEAIQGIATEEAQKPFGLAAGPLVRATVLRLAEDDHVAIIVMHHIAADGWSMGVFISEFAALYRAFSEGKDSPLADLPIQYKDYARWQRQTLQQQDLDQLIAYWKSQLDGAPHGLQLPTDRPRTRATGYAGAKLSLLLPKPLCDALKELSAREGVTLFMTLLAAFATMLGRNTGQDDLLIGSPTARRERPETQGLIGFLVNTLVLRINLSGDPAFRELLKRTRETVLGAFAHQDLPFDKLVETIRPERSLGGDPLVQVMFALQNMPLPPLIYPGVTISLLDVDPGTSPMDLDAACYEDREGIRVIFLYRTALFDRATVERLARQFQTLLQAVTVHPEHRLSELPLLTESERKLIVSDWNDAHADLPHDDCVHHLFERQAEKTPDATAVVFEKGQLSYKQLDRRANQLAHYLRARGVGPEMPVAICLERSPEMLVGLLGILKAGGAYLPLDPQYPTDRLSYMLNDSGARLLVSDGRLSRKLSMNQVETILLDSDCEAIAREPETPLRRVTLPENLAYIIYTSGSTGEPKGVLIRHSSVVNHVLTTIKRLEIQPSDRMLQFASISFDTAVEEIFPTLAVGATLVLRPDSLLDSVPTFLQKCRELALTILDLPTAYWHELTKQLVANNWTLPPQARLVYIGGERALPERVEAWREHIGKSVRLMNGYGPTEVTVVAANAELCGAKMMPAVWPEVPIGRPVENVQAYVLDCHMQPVPIGVAGELYVGGAGLARGYHNRPALTAERFLPNPFSHEPGARLFKTGDVVRYRADGSLECFGRSDQQVKVRGLRVELGEIETKLRQHPLVEDAVVILREDATDDRRLAAYYVVKSGSELKTSELRRFLKSQLPSFMVPAHLIQLAALPVAPGGKIDRSALPAPDHRRPEMDQEFVAPRTELERTLAGLWAEALQIDRVGIHDDFFALGGHSLLAVKLMHRVKEATQADVPLRTLFESPTIAGLASAIERFGGDTSFPMLTPMAVSELRAEVVLNSAIQPGDVVGAALCGRPPSTATDGSRGARDGPPYRSIFLTGATGFLGVFLLRELLEQTSADLFCLVRATDAEDGRKRLRAALESYSLWDERLNARIIPVVGDLAKPRLGLSNEQFEMLETTVESIYHAGASVNFAYSYSALKAANVLGTEEVLRLASAKRIKPVHFISTLFVFPASDDLGSRLGEDDDIAQDGVLYGGYAQSKWVAERLVTMARERGLPVCIYRPGRITGHSRTGVWNPDDALGKLIKSWIQLGIVPKLDAEVKLDMTPVDYVSRAIVHLSLEKESLGKAFHLLNPQPLPLATLVEWIRSFGYPLQAIPFDEWRQQLTSFVANLAGNDSLSVLGSTTILPEKASVEEFLSKVWRLRFDCQQTLAALRGSSVVCPPPDETLLRTYFAEFIRGGFLPAPPSGDQPQSKPVTAMV